MKLPSIIYAIVLGLAAAVQAQEKATNPNEPSKQTTPPGGVSIVPQPAIITGGRDARATTSMASINMELSGGRLVDAIAQIENHVSGGGEGAPPMPTLIYSAVDVQELPLPGKFRLTGVTPVQAVALACAAAGCTLEPIYAPDEGTSSSEAVQKVIGYRIVQGSAQYPLPPASKPTAFTSLGTGEKIQSDIAAATRKLIELRAQYNATHPSVIAGEKELVKLQRALEQSTVESKRISGIPLATQGGGGGNLTIGFGGDGYSGGTERLKSSPKSAPSADTTERVVRVYALGSLLGKIDENSSVENLKRRSELIQATEDLVGKTLAQAELNAVKSPDLAFNDSLRVLVAKATAAQHEIISQIVQALKENETVPAQDNNVMPTTETILPAPTPAASAENPKSNP